MSRHFPHCGEFQREEWRRGAVRHAGVSLPAEYDMGRVVGVVRRRPVSGSCGGHPEPGSRIWGDVPDTVIGGVGRVRVAVQVRDLDPGPRERLGEDTR
jgi:hypothetical protein